MLKYNNIVRNTPTIEYHALYYYGDIQRCLFGGIWYTCAYLVEYGTQVLISRNMVYTGAYLEEYGTQVLIRKNMAHRDAYWEEYGTQGAYWEEYGT